MGYFLSWGTSWNHEASNDFLHGACHGTQHMTRIAEILHGHIMRCPLVKETWKPMEHTMEEFSLWAIPWDTPWKIMAGPWYLQWGMMYPMGSISWSPDEGVCPTHWANHGMLHGIYHRKTMVYHTISRKSKRRGITHCTGRNGVVGHQQVDKCTININVLYYRSLPRHNVERRRSR